MNTWVPARTLADPKAILLGLVVGLVSGSGLTYLAVGRTTAAGSSAGPQWKHAAEWAKDPRLSKWQKEVMNWYETHSDHPEIELLEFLPSRIYGARIEGVVVFRAREKNPAGGVSVNTRVIAIDHGKLYEYGDGYRDHYMSNGTPANDGVVIAGRPR